MKPMSTVPTDRNIILHMPDHSTFRAGLEEFEGEDADTYGWVCHDYGKAPADWHDDVCWAMNENGEQSTQPVGWSELAALHRLPKGKWCECGLPHVTGGPCWECRLDRGIDNE